MRACTCADTCARVAFRQRFGELAAGKIHKQWSKLKALSENDPYGDEQLLDKIRQGLAAKGATAEAIEQRVTAIISDASIKRDDCARHAAAALTLYTCLNTCLHTCIRTCLHTCQHTCQHTCPAQMPGHICTYI